MKGESKSKIGSFAKRVVVALGKDAVRYAAKSYMNRGKKRKRTRSRREFKTARSKAMDHLRQRNPSMALRNRMDIKKMKCFINARTAVHVHRTRGCGHVKSTLGTVGNVEFVVGGRIQDIESAAANLRYFDPGTNALVTASAVAGTYSHDMCVTVTRKLTLTNNYQIPCNLQVWSCTPKNATGISVIGAWDAGLVDQGGISKTSPLVYVTDSRDLRNIWNIKRVVNKRLQPGQTAVASTSTRQFDYTVATNDIHTLDYQKRQGGHIFLVRVVGSLGHASGGEAECNVLASGVDALIDNTYRFEYDAGKDLHDYSVIDNASGTFTSAGVLSSRPIADNQGYEEA